jgi:hypothetical protein
MVKSASLFSQLLKQIPRNEFAGLVNRHQGERHAKGFTCWAQLTAMLFCQLAHADSLREICNGLACCLGKPVHLGIDRKPTKSNLSYANARRPAAMFEDLFWSMTARFRADGHLGGRQHKFRFRNKLLSLDSTTISLCLKLFPRAEFRRAKGGVKAHVLLDHDDYLPSCVLISEAKMHDSKVLGSLKLQPGSIVAMDRAYNDYKQFARWTEDGVYFVTRMKENAVYEVVQCVPVPVNRSILSDEMIELTGPQLRRYQRERPSHSDLEGLDRDAPAEMAAPSVEGGVVALKPGDDASPEPLHLPGVDGMARRSIQHATTRTIVRAARAGPAMIRTGHGGRRSGKGQPQPGDRRFGLVSRYEMGVRRRNLSRLGQQCSEILSQLPCLGVNRKSRRRTSSRAWRAGKAS